MRRLLVFGLSMLLVVSAAQQLLADTVNTVTFDNYGGSNAASITGTDLLSISRTFNDPKAIDMVVGVTVSGDGLFAASETITNAAGLWTELTFRLLNPIDGLKFLSLNVIDDANVLEAVKISDQEYQILKIDRGIIAPRDTPFVVNYVVEMPQSGSFTVQAVDMLVAPTPSASIAIMGLFATALVFGRRRHRK